MAGDIEPKKTEGDPGLKPSHTAESVLQHYKDPLEQLVPPINIGAYEAGILDENEILLRMRRRDRSFTILSAMDPDAVATHALLHRLHPDIPISLVYPRMSNQIDKERQGRRDRYVSEFGVESMTLQEIRNVLTAGGDMPRVSLYEFRIDDVVDAFRISTGLADPDLGNSEGLFYNNALGELLNAYWSTVANATRGVRVGTLNGTALGLGDYYHLGLDGETYPLAPLLRTDVNRLLKAYCVPSRLRDLSPWHQKVRGTDGLEGSFWQQRPTQKTHPDVRMLPRNFYRVADPVLCLLDEGIHPDQIKMELQSAIAEHDLASGMETPDDVLELTGAMVDATVFLSKQAHGKNSIHQHRFPKMPALHSR